MDRSAAGIMDDAEGMNDEMRFGSGRLVATLGPLWASAIVGNVVSAIIDSDVLAISRV